MMKPKPHLLKTISLLALSHALMLSAGIVHASVGPSYHIVPLGLPIGAAQAPQAQISVTLNDYPLAPVVNGEPYAFDFNDVLEVSGDPDYNASQVAWSVDPALPAWASFENGLLSGTPAGFTQAQPVITATYKGKSDAQAYQLAGAVDVTVRCAGMADGTEFDVNGKTYIVTNTKAAALASAERACTSNVTSMKEWFINTSGFAADLSAWDVSNVTNMVDLFRNSKGFAGDMSGWKLNANVNLNGLFGNSAIYVATNFAGNIGSWDVSAVKSLRGAFRYTKNFNLDLSAWDVSNVTNMTGLFDGSSGFASDLSAWDVSNVTNMGYFAYNATDFNPNLSMWCVTKITSAPSNLNPKDGSWEASRQPAWGTCPTP